MAKCRRFHEYVRKCNSTRRERQNVYLTAASRIHAGHISAAAGVLSDNRQNNGYTYVTSTQNNGYTYVTLPLNNGYTICNLTRITDIHM